MVDSEYGDGPWNDEKMVLNQMNRESEEGEIAEVVVSTQMNWESVEGETIEVEVFAVDLKVLVTIVRRLIEEN